MMEEVTNSTMEYDKPVRKNKNVIIPFGRSDDDDTPEIMAPPTRNPTPLPPPPPAGQNNAINKSNKEDRAINISSSPPTTPPSPPLKQKCLNRNLIISIIVLVVCVIVILVLSFTLGGGGHGNKKGTNSNNNIRGSSSSTAIGGGGGGGGGGSGGTFYNIDIDWQSINFNGFSTFYSGASTSVSRIQVGSTAWDSGEDVQVTLTSVERGNNLAHMNIAVTLQCCTRSWENVQATVGSGNYSPWTAVRTCSCPDIMFDEQVRVRINRA